jgi:MoxR-like ATPase
VSATSTAHADILLLKQRIAQSIIGQDALIDQMILGLLSNGHLLLESLPGLAKTRAVKSLARNLAAKMSRVQFTPDLLPSDITGSEVLHQEGGKNLFRFEPGPLFGNIILADEINRAPAKVQAALLEAMEERQVTVAGTTHSMPPLFMVLATQNPIEQEGTYPLPEAQTDRFLMKVLVDYPDPQSEIGVLALNRSEELGHAAQTAVEAPIAIDSVLAARAAISGIRVADAIAQYIVDIINATRHPDRYDATLATWIQLGASPRGGIGLDHAARAHAWLDGRDFVAPDDVRAVAHPVLRHRLMLSYNANADGVRPDQVLDKLLQLVAVPA